MSYGTLEEALAALEEQMQDLEGKNSSLKAIIYGRSGVGKTVAATQMAQMLTPADKIILYIDTAEGWTSLQNFPALKNRIKRLTDSRVSTLELVVQGIANRIGQFANVGAVIIDEHTSVFDNDLHALTRMRASTIKDKDPDTPAWPDRNTAKNRAVNLMAQLVRMEDVHLFLLGHERTDNDSIGRPVSAPAYTPAAVDGLSGLSHVTARMSADEVPNPNGSGEASYERTLQVHPTSTVIAKTRVGGLPVRVTTKQLIEATQEWLKGDRDTVEKQQVIEQRPNAPEPTAIINDPETAETGADVSDAFLAMIGE